MALWVGTEHLIAGTLAGLVSTVTLYPLELIKTRMQVIDGVARNAYMTTPGAIQSVLKSEGVPGLYRGMTPAIFASSGSWGGYFYFYEASKRRKLKAKMENSDEEEIKKTKLGVFDHLLSGIEAGSILVLLFNPVWLVKTRLALQDMPTEVRKGKDAVKNGRKYKGMVDALATIFREEGVKGLYQGVVPALLLTSHGAVQFAAYEYMKVIAQSVLHSDQQAPWVSIFLGGSSKIIASTITYPYQVIKSRLQQRGSTVGGQAVYKYKGTIDCAMSLWKEAGIRGFFRGLVPNVMKVAPSAALTFVVYEEAMKILK